MLFMCRPREDVLVSSLTLLRCVCPFKFWSHFHIREDFDTESLLVSATPVAVIEPPNKVHDVHCSAYCTSLYLNCVFVVLLFYSHH